MLINRNDYQNHHDNSTHGPLLTSQVSKSCDSLVSRYDSF